jgi:hypothetical protein
MPRQAVSVREAASPAEHFPSNDAHLYWFEGHSHCSGGPACSRPDEECERGRIQRIGIHSVAQVAQLRD